MKEFAADVRDRRRWVLMRLGQLFAKIDEAFARGDHLAAQALAPEVALLLAEADWQGRPPDQARQTGIRKRER
jgi:hypothetical protein